MSLSGRTPEIENSGASASSDTVPATSARGARSRSAGNTSSRARQNIAAATIASAPPSRDHTASATASSRIGASDDADPRERRKREMPQPDVHGIAGRMRLVLRRIEVPQAEREVDRVDVFERLGQDL